MEERARMTKFVELLAICAVVTGSCGSNDARPLAAIGMHAGNGDRAGSPVGLRPILADTFHAVEGGFRARLSASSAQSSARVLFPARSTGTLVIEDAATDVGVDISLGNARDA